MAEIKPILVTKRIPYVAVLSELERRAYHVAHRIMTERAYTDRLATPGGRRTATVDAIAQIIMEEFKETDGKN